MSAFGGGWPSLSLISFPVQPPAPPVPTPPATSFGIPMSGTSDLQGTPYVLPAVATPSIGAARLLRPSWTTLASGKCPYRPWVNAIIDGYEYFANGYDQAWYADVSGSAFWPLGSVAPTSFAVADAAAGATFPTGTTLFYFLVFRNEDRGEETAPQPTTNAGGVPVAGVTHVMAATKNALVTWTAAEATARFPSVSIYRRRQNDNGMVLVATVASSLGTYTDSTPDSSLSTAVEDIYFDRFRLDLPPVFKGIAAHVGRLFGFTGEDALLYYGQQAVPVDQLLETDFPPENVLPVEIDDGLGPVTALVAHYDVLLAFKRRGCYQITGDGTADAPFVVTQMFKDRGCIGARCAVSLLAALVFLDESGLYAWATSGEPVVVAGKGATAASPLAPLWTGRLNLDAADMMQVTQKEGLGYVEARVALDNSPQARHRVRWNFRDDRYESVDDGLVSCAAGRLDDGGGMQHDVRLDDLGLLWEEDVGESEGVYAGSVVAAVSTGSGRSVGSSGAPWSTDDLLGALGCPVDRISSSGVVVDENRVAAVPASGTLTMLRWSSVAVASTQSVAVGSVRDYFELPFTDFASGEWKTVQRWIAEHEVEAAGYLRFDTTADERDYFLRREVLLSATEGWGYVHSFDRGHRMKLRASSRFAGWGWTLRALRATWRSQMKGV